MIASRSAAAAVGAGCFLAATLVGCGGGADRVGPPITVSDAVVGAPASSTASDAAAYLTVHNRGARDRLIGVSSPAARNVTMHTTEALGAATAMLRVESLVVPADGVLEFEPGGDHLMIEGLRRSLPAGGVIRLRLTFEDAGPVDVDATAVPLQELPERIGRR